MATSPKLDIQGDIRRSQKFQYISTHHLPANRTVQAVPYYVRRKRQMIKKQQSHKMVELPIRKAHMEDLKKEISQSLISHKEIDPYLQNYIRQVSIEPVIADNRFTNFKEEDYPLTQGERVRVASEKMFPLQNYYNYLYELENQKQISRLVKQVYHMHPKQTEQHQPYHQKQKEDNVNNRHIDVMKIKGYHQTRFQTRDNYDNLNQAKTVFGELMPHSDYSTDKNGKNINFIPKQQKRLQISRRVIQEQAQKNWYY